MEGLDNDF
jgi:hypothetical protein